MMISRLSVGLVLASAALAQMKVAYEVDSGRVLDRYAIVPKGTLNLATTRNAARAFLQEQVGRKRLFRLVIAEDAAVLSRSTGTAPTDTDGYAWAADMLKRLGYPQGPIARVFGIGERALLTFRNGNTLEEETLPGGYAPTRIVFGESIFRILHFHLTQGGPAIIPQPSYKLVIFALAQPRVAVSSTSRATRELVRITGDRQLSLAVRSDPWFVDHGEFPYAYPFATNLSFPSRSQFLPAASLSCSLHADGKVKCAGRNFEP
jgi:hypothetical protein